MLAVRIKQMTKNVLNNLNPKRFWILGAGHFGQIAVERITKNIPDAEITIVDKAPIKPLEDRLPIIKEDGISWLKDNFYKDAPVDMIIPAIPVHVVAQWIKLRLLNHFEIHPVDVSDSLMSKLPNPIKGSHGQVFASHANFTCPDNCPEPENICMHTGLPRKKELYSLFCEIDLSDFFSIVIRSYQLFPGVGGIFPDNMLEALNLICRNHNQMLMIGTACRCHGVLDFIRMVPRH